MKLTLTPFSLLVSILTLFTNPIDASTNCDTLHLINGKEVLITEHKFYDNKFHYFKCGDELLETKHIIDKKSIVKIVVNQAFLIKKKEVVKTPKKVKKVKKKRVKKKIKKKKETKYNAYLGLKDGGVIKGTLYSRKNNEVTINLGGNLERYSFSDLENLQIQKKNKLARGILAGVITGLGLAVIQFSAASRSQSSAYGTFPDFPDQKESIVIAAVSTIGATMVTLLVVKAKVNIPLTRKQKKRDKIKLINFF